MVSVELGAVLPPAAVILKAFPRPFPVKAQALQ